MCIRDRSLARLSGTCCCNALNRVSGRSLQRERKKQHPQHCEKPCESKGDAAAAAGWVFRSLTDRASAGPVAVGGGGAR
eukprot:2724811-Rhodomonas_salina.1